MGFRLSFSILQQLLLLLTLCTLGCTQQYCVKRERLALLDFKKSFASFSRNDGKLSSWNSSKEAHNCCKWEGITCDNHTLHVISLGLGGLDLVSHQLRPSLLELQHLTRLGLSFNNLAMIVPKFFGSFSKLVSLDIREAGFYGMIPPQLGNLSNIQTLSISSSKLSTDNFQWLSRLSSLEIFQMGNLNFSEARDWLSVIGGLPLLSSFTCKLCYFPTPYLSSRSIATHHVNSSSSLQTLDIEDGYMPSYALSLLVNNTSSLLDLKLEYLKLDVPMPSVFHHMISLQSLILRDINLEVGIFNSIGNLCGLKELWCNGCIINESLSDIIQALSGCASSSLEGISFLKSNLTGTIPSMLKFQPLTYLLLRENCLENFSTLNANTIPLFPANLTILNLEVNNLNGILSDEHFTNLSRLQYLYLAYNPDLKVCFNNPPIGLQYVDLCSCNLGPNFPSWLLSPENFVYLDISGSKISDTIPTIFWKNLSPFLYYLNLSHNSLNGIVPNIPLQFSYSNLVIDVSSNSFYGRIPFFFFLANVLYLANNNFSGFAPIIPHYHKLPTSLPKMYDSVDHSNNIIDLSDNLLSGPIPHWFWFQKPKLGALILTNNNLSGTISSSIGHMIHLRVISLRNNSFMGPLPSALKNCHAIIILDLAGNRFSGFIPYWMGEDLKDLIVLSLGSNSLSGILPASLCHLKSLQILDVSHNMLSGTIPSCMHDFSAMAHNVYSSQEVSFWDKAGPNYARVEEAPYFKAYIKWKSKAWQFQSTLRFVKLMDLSSNNLSGEIPTGLTSLVEIDSVDLSCNNLQGSIPEQIGTCQLIDSVVKFHLASQRYLGWEC